MSTTIQLVENGKALPAMFVDKDLHLNKLIAATVAAVNLWAKIQDGSENNTYDLCLRKVMDDFGGVLFSPRPVEAVYQVDYKENAEEGDLKITKFIYWNRFLQCKAFGSVYGFCQYNQLGIEATMPNKFYQFDRSVGSDGKLINPKQYNIILEPDEVDKELMKHQDALADEKKEETPTSSEEQKSE